MLEKSGIEYTSKGFSQFMSDMGRANAQGPGNRAKSIPKAPIKIPANDAVIIDSGRAGHGKGAESQRNGG